MIIQSKRVYIDGKFVKAQIDIDKDQIVDIYTYGKNIVDIDYGNKRIVPGFYDIHAHGYLGYDTTATGKNGLKKWLKDLPKEGVCGVCPTTLTQSHDTLIKALKEVEETKKENPEGAIILGIHLEGPYIDRKYKGAQPEEYIVEGNVEEFKQYQNACNGLIKIITLAPEHDKNFKLIQYCAKNQINASIGHSNADFDTAISAIKSGAKGFTHTYNCMSAFSHRENGIVGAAFISKNTYAEIICDGNHCSLAALEIFFNEKKDYGIMVSDSLMCKGYPVGSKFDFGGQEVEIYPDGSAHLTAGKKNLAGSTLKINEGLKILVEKANVPFEYAIDACSKNPAIYLGLGESKGQIKKGFDSDIVVLDDDYSVLQTFCLGIMQL